MRAIAVLSLSIALASAEIPQPDDAPQPLSPEASKQHFQLPEGFRIDLVASEPLIRDPSCIAWTEDGGLFVTEIHGYNLEGHLDVTELNKSGELATAIERVRVGPEMKAEAGKGQTGALKLLRDTDGDGHMDEAITWADDIPAAYGVVAARDGVIVTASPHILYFADTDGDDRPDVRETLFTGFEPGEMERAINNPVWGPDGWLYAGQGWGGGTITGPKLKGEVKMGRHDFRFKADGSAIEPVSGSNNTFGMTFDAAGNRFLITTSRPALYAVPLPYRYLKRNPHVPTPDLTATASDYHTTFPTSTPHPWRRKRGADPRWVKFYGQGEAKPNGNFTSACGQQIYTSTLFPDKYHGNYFCCDPQQNLVHRAIVERDGPGLKVRRPPEHADNEFLTSTDGWFRPTNLRVGPDGALYIVDMYREIIEDYSAIPRYLQQQYGLLNGDDRGRIWRLAPAASLRRRAIPKRWPPRHLLNPIYDISLAERAVLEGDELAKLIHALRSGDAKIDEGKGALQTLLAIVDSADDPNVLLQLALSLGESSDPRAVAALAKIAAEHGEMRWMDAAVLSSLKDKAGDFLQIALAAYPEMNPKILEGAAVTAAREGDIEALITASEHADAALQLRLLSLAAEHGDDTHLKKLRSAANLALSVNGSSEKEQLAALALARFASPWNVAVAISHVFDPKGSAEFQTAAVTELLRSGNTHVAELIIAELPNTTPRIAAVIVDKLLAKPETTKLLLQSDVAVSLSALQRHLLATHEDVAIRELASSSRSVPPKLSTIGIHQKHFEALDKETRDITRGEALFTTHCATCHQLGGKGIAVGPTLDAEAGRPAASLLSDILAPSAKVTAGYATFMAKTNDGATHTGVLRSDSATSITLIQAAGVRTDVLRNDLASLERLDLSLMPTSFAQLMSPAEMADLIAFVKAKLKRAGSLVLFNDETAFPLQLTEGRGTATLDTADASSGSACLTIDTQRFAKRIPGWNFAIREHPAEGEFRYLRVAMKTRTAKGIMIEFAADGVFPPEDKPIRTYYAGENSTGWVSNELAKDVPKDWQTFTIDLWVGNGDFTLTGVAFTPMNAVASYDRIELLTVAPQPAEPSGSTAP